MQFSITAVSNDLTFYLEFLEKYSFQITEKDEKRQTIPKGLIVLDDLSSLQQFIQHFKVFFNEKNASFIISLGNDLMNISIYDEWNE